MTTPTPRDDLAQQILTLAGEVREAQSRLRELGDPGTLRAQVTGLKRKLETFTGADSGGITGLAVALGGVSDRVTAIEEMLTGRGGSEVWDFTGLPGALEGDAREQAWERLTTWVKDVLGGVYQLTAAGPRRADEQGAPPKLPDCWDKHPDLVAEVAWLAQEWIQIYRTPYGTPARAAAWHASLLPGLRERIVTTTAGRCSRKGEHVDPGPAGPRSPGSLRPV
jgi:hypothetical protein